MSNHFLRVLGKLAFALCLLHLTAPSASAEGATGDLRSLILNAVKSGQPRLVIPHGVYRVSPLPNSAAMISVEKARNLDIVADGVTMICTKRMRALQFSQSVNLTLRGLTIDYDPLTFTQGKVVAIAPDLSSMDIKLDAGYPQVLFDRIVICDPKTRFHKYGINHHWGTKASWASASVVRITLPGVAENVDLGDPVAMSGGQEMGACHGITVGDQCSNIVFRDLTLHCAPGMGIIDADSDIGLKLLGCKIVPGPKPAGATEERLLTTSWDGIQCNVARVGTQVENCVIERCGDDSWSVPTRPFKVRKRDSTTVFLQVPEYCPPDGGLRVGDHLVLRTLTVDAVQLVQGLSTTELVIGDKSTYVVQVTLAGALPAETGDYLFDQDCSSQGFIYRNNQIYSHGRGALIKVGNGLIEGNSFRGSDKAIMVNSEIEKGNGVVDHLIIRGNTIKETGYHQAMPWSEQAGAVSLTSSMGGGQLRPVGLFNDILIENNTFDTVKGLNLMISSARDVMVKNNRFLNTHSTDPGRHNGADYKIDATAVIEVTQADKVRFSGNVIRNMGPFAKHAIVLDPSATNISGADHGIQVTQK